MEKEDIIRVGIYVLIFINVFLLNVILHEIGHYIAADYYNLEPEVEIDLNSVGNLGFGFKGVPIASTSFNEPSSENEFISVVLMGPLLNLLLMIIFFIGFIFFRENKYLKEIMIIGFVISISSFIMNIIPIEGTDGNLLFGLI